MYPLVSVRNFIPSSTELGSPSSSGAGGTTVEAHSVHGQVRVAATLIATPGDGVSMLPVSS
jgi:hypothetical protein